jgi:hypothetical protein
MATNKKVYMQDIYPHDNYIFEDAKDRNDKKSNFQLQDFFGPVMTKNLTESKVVVFYDFKKKKFIRLYDLSKRLKLDIRFVLIRTEPRIIIPSQYNEKIEKLFDLIIDFGRLQQNNFKHVNGEVWPVSPEVFRKVSHSFNDGDLIDKAILISSNKNNFMKENLYVLRKKVVDELSLIVDVYGDGWKNFRINFVRQLIGAIFLGIINYKQSFVFSREFICSISWPKRSANRHLKVRSKAKYYKLYKVILVIENSGEYLSEKFFEALASGRPVVYVGTDLEKWGIPSDVYVKANKSLESIRDCVEELVQNVELRKKVCRNAQEWLQKKSTLEKFSREKVFQRTATIVQIHANDN